MTGAAASARRRPHNRVSSPFRDCSLPRNGGQLSEEGRMRAPPTKQLPARTAGHLHRVVELPARVQRGRIGSRSGWLARPEVITEERDDAPASVLRRGLVVADVHNSHQS